MKLLLTSIPHSGTQFFQAIIEPDTTSHWTSTAVEGFLAKAETVACAVRHPAAIWRSWHNRGKIPETSDKHWDIAWKRFRDLAPKQTIFYLPIDHEDRGLYLSLLAAHLGKVFAPDWDQPVNPGLEDRGPPPPKDFTLPFSIPIIRELYADAN